MTVELKISFNRPKLCAVNIVRKCIKTWKLEEIESSLEPAGWFTARLSFTVQGARAAVYSFETAIVESPG